MASLVDVRQRVVGLRPEVRTALVLSGALLLYGNANAVFPSDTRDSFLLWSNLALLALLLVWSLWVARLSLSEIGLAPGSILGSALFGLVLSLLAAIPPVLFIVLAPLYNGGAIEAPDITERSGSWLAYFLLFRQPVGTALFEEVAFRGALYGAWLRVGGDRAAFRGTSVTFALWHGVITSKTVIDSGVVDAPLATAGGVALSLAGLFVGGLIFAYLRWHTRSIAAAVVAHWLIVALMTVAVWTR
jgi:membrane protease YdiL (CAAX protease family)